LSWVQKSKKVRSFRSFYPIKWGIQELIFKIQVTESNIAPKKTFMKVVHENKFAQAYYDDANKVIWHRYNDLVNAELLIACHRADMEFVKTNLVIGCFYDLTKMKGTFTKALNFIVSEYEPTLSMNKVRYGSFAMKEKDVFMKFAMNQMFNLMDTKMELRVHREIADAVTWLGEKMKTKIAMVELPKNHATPVGAI
jgi:hypothetical protein